MIRPDSLHEIERVEASIKNRIPVGSSCAYKSLVDELVGLKVLYIYLGIFC